MLYKLFVMIKLLILLKLKQIEIISLHHTRFNSYSTKYLLLFKNPNKILQRIINIEQKLISILNQFLQTIQLFNQQKIIRSKFKI